MAAPDHGHAVDPAGAIAVADHDAIQAALAPIGRHNSLRGRMLVRVENVRPATAVASDQLTGDAGGRQALQDGAPPPPHPSLPVRVLPGQYPYPGRPGTSPGVSPPPQGVHRWPLWTPSRPRHVGVPPQHPPPPQGGAMPAPSDCGDDTRGPAGPWLAGLRISNSHEVRG